MSRLDKFFSRLEEIEKEFIQLLLEEFQKELKSKDSRYFTRMNPGWADGRSSQTSQIAKLEKLEKEIVNLRTKLSLSQTEGPVYLINECAEQYRKATSSETTRVVKDYYSKFQSMI